MVKKCQSMSFRLSRCTVTFSLFHRAWTNQQQQQHQDDDLLTTRWNGPHHHRKRRRKSLNDFSDWSLRPSRPPFCQHSKESKTSVRVIAQGKHREREALARQSINSATEGT